VDQVVEMAVCMANGGGGTVVFGVRDRVVGRAAALLGVPAEIDINLLLKAVYDRTDPRLTPVFEELMVPEGTGRLLLMQVYGGLPPYTDSQGRAKVRVGKDCLPLTGSLRRRVLVETGESDFTSGQVDGRPADLLSAAAMEHLRDAARRENAPEDLLHLSDPDLLAALDLLRDGRLSFAGLFLAGHPDALRRHLPRYVCSAIRSWTRPPRPACVSAPSPRPASCSTTWRPGWAIWSAAEPGAAPTGRYVPTCTVNWPALAIPSATGASPGRRPRPVFSVS
jgi:ATP-dependent DNA helicase RecG